MAQMLVVLFDGPFELSCKEYIFMFKGRKFRIVSGKDGSIHKILTITDGSDAEYEQAMETILSFFNYMAWEHGLSFSYCSSYGTGISNDKKIELLNVTAEDSVDSRGALVVLDYLPPVTNEAQEIALGLYNEALATDSVFFKTINFWKILCVPRTPQDRVKENKVIKWINNNVSKIYQSELFKELIKNEKDIGNYIYNEYRNALHHIERKPTLSPTKLNDRTKVAIISWPMRELATMYIEEELQLKGYSEKLNILSTVI